MELFCDACGASIKVRAFWRCFSPVTGHYIDLCNHHYVVNQYKLDDNSFDVYQVAEVESILNGS